LLPCPADLSKGVVRGKPSGYTEQLTRLTMRIQKLKALLISRLRVSVSRQSTVVCLLFLSLAPVVWASQNPNRSVVASGGTVAAQSSTHRVSGTVGQIASTRAQSATNKLAGGFWNTVGMCECPFIGDLDTNGFIDVLDVVAMVNVAFRNGAMPPGDPQCPLATRADLNCDTFVDIFDVVGIVNTAFRGNDSRCNPCL